MKPWNLHILALFLCILHPCTHAYPQKHSSYKGWDYLAEKLINDGIPAEEVRRIFSSKEMPTRPFVPFGIKPAEPHDIYSAFLDKKRLAEAKKFLTTHDKTFTAAEKKFGVDRHVINAILFVETQHGRFTGNNRILVRLARGASVGEKSNVLKNFERLIKEGEKTTLKEVADRSKQVEKIFYPEIKSLLTLGRQLKINIFNVYGSRAGAFGLPQFLPSSYLKFAIDGNQDGKTSLFQVPDAIFSVANYLAHNGWRNSSTKAEKLDVIWTYNKSTPYCETILKVAESTQKEALQS
jgi:membrane-bound lytic murein transglycosylase B